MAHQRHPACPQPWHAIACYGGAVACPRAPKQCCKLSGSAHPEAEGHLSRRPRLVSSAIRSLGLLMRPCPDKLPHGAPSFPSHSFRARPALMGQDRPGAARDGACALSPAEDVWHCPPRRSSGRAGLARGRGAHAAQRGLHLRERRPARVLAVQAARDQLAKLRRLRRRDLRGRRQPSAFPVPLVGFLQAPPFNTRSPASRGLVCKTHAQILLARARQGHQRQATSPQTGTARVQRPLAARGARSGPQWPRH